MDIGIAKTSKKPSKTLTCQNFQLLPQMQFIFFAFPSFYGSPRPETFIGKEMIEVILLAYSYGSSASALSIL